MSVSNTSGAYPGGALGPRLPPPADKCTKLSWCKRDIRVKDNMRAWWPFFLRFTWLRARKLNICGRVDLFVFFLLFTWLWAENEQLQIAVSPLSNSWALPCTYWCRMHERVKHLAYMRKRFKTRLKKLIRNVTTAKEKNKRLLKAASLQINNDKPWYRLKHDWATYVIWMTNDCKRPGKLADQENSCSLPECRGGYRNFWWRGCNFELGWMFTKYKDVKTRKLTHQPFGIVSCQGRIQKFFYWGRDTKFRYFFKRSFFSGRVNFMQFK